MATIFSPSAVFSNSAATATTPRLPQSPAAPKTNLSIPLTKHPLATLVATAAAATILTTAPPSLADSPPATNYQLYYGTAASAANYGGYGGNSSKQASAEYVYDVPEGWKERLVSKVEKGMSKLMFNSYFTFSVLIK